MARHLTTAVLTILSVVAFLVLTTKATRAQGLYESEWTDASAWHGLTGDLNTEVNSYIDNVSQCGGASVSSMLNGVQGFPNGQGFILQTVSPASPDVEYVWTITVGGLFPTPYGCFYEEASTSLLVKITLTYWGTVVEGSGGECDWLNIACTSGTPTCTAPSNGSFFLWPFCPPYVLDLWVAIRPNGGAYECYDVINVGEESPGACN